MGTGELSSRITVVHQRDSEHVFKTKRFELNVGHGSSRPGLYQQALHLSEEGLKELQ